MFECFILTWNHDFNCCQLDCTVIVMYTQDTGKVSGSDRIQQCGSHTNCMKHQWRTLDFIFGGINLTKF